MPFTLEQVNQMPPAEFREHFGGVFEHSSWVAARAALRRPFESVAAMHRAMCDVVTNAATAEQEGLLNVHPDLVGRLAREGKLTRESTSEQAAAGLTQLSEEEIAQFEKFNAAYREKFMFPFIICARLNRKEAILAAFPKRLMNDWDSERITALAEVFKIAELRLRDLVTE